MSDYDFDDFDVEDTKPVKQQKNSQKETDKKNLNNPGKSKGIFENNSIKKEKDEQKPQKSVQFKLGGTIGQFDNVKDNNQKKQENSPVRAEDLPNSLRKQKEKDELELKKSYLNLEDIISDSSSNKHIIYKFMKKGFTALTAEELACTMVNPTFTGDFKKNTKEDWSINYQSKVIEKLQRCKFHMHWLNKQVTAQGYDNKHEEFMKSVAVGDLDKVFKYLRKNNIDEVLNSVEEKSKRSPLHIAAKAGHIHLIEFFLNKNSNLEARDKLLKTALHYACENGHTLAVKLLMEHNADPFEKDNCGRTSLHYAVYSGKTDIMALLTQHNTDIVHIKDHAGRTPLHHAVFMEANQVLIIQKLLNYGADVNSLDLEKRTPLHHASESGKSRIIPILIQRGAQTFLKDSLTNKTPLELAMNDHIKELIIAYCQPQYMPNEVQINKMEQKRYAEISVNKKGQIERSLQNQNLEKPLSYVQEKPKKKKRKIDDQSQESMIAQNTQLQVIQTTEVDKGLGPVSAWEKQKDEFIPYNIRNYQERLMSLLRRIQKFGVESFIYQKKPYLYTGSWMEYVRNLDDLMLQINGVNPNEATMKIFNILFPYPEPLPLGKGDESALTGFFDGKAKINVSQEQRECLPEQLLENIQKQEQKQTEQTIRNNELGNVQDLLDIRQEVLQLRSANNALQFMVDQKDEMINKLKYFQSLDNDEKYLKLQQENKKLEDQLNQVVERNADLESKLVNLKLLKNDNQKQTDDGETNKNLINIIDKLVDKHQTDETQKRSKNSRIKAIKSVSKSKESIREKNKNQIRSKIQEQIFLDDEQTLQIMLQKLQKEKKGDLKQRLIKIAGSDKSLISEKHFQTLIKDQMKMTYSEFTKLQRAVGFGDAKKESKLLKIEQIMNNVNDILQEVEQKREEVIQKVSILLKEQGLNLEESYNYFDKNENGSFDINQLQEGFNQLEVEVTESLNKNLFASMDQNGEGTIDFKKFQAAFQKYYNEHSEEESQKNQEERVVSYENINEEDEVDNNLEEQDENKEDDEKAKDDDPEMNEEVKNDEGQNEGVEVEEIVEDDNSNQMTNKQQLDADEFDTIQDIPDEELQVQEEKRVQDIKSGKLKTKTISGELILKIRAGDDFPNVKGKEQFAFEISMPRYNQKGKQIPQKGVAKLGLYSKDTKKFKIKPMRIKISEQNLFIFSEIIVINVYKLKQDQTNFESANKTYIGSAQLCWKEVVLMVFKGISPARDFRLTLQDNQLINTAAQISGQLSGEIFWVNFGHEKSYFDQNGNKKDAQTATLKNNLNPIQKPNPKEALQQIILTDLVNPEDKIDHKTLKQNLEQFFTATGVQKEQDLDYKEDILAIFQKITEWKKQMGDSEQQEQQVSNSLKPNKSLKIHNINTALEKISELKEYIRLTEKECYFIIFSSIDHEYFNHLLLQQGEFIKWFTINFEEKLGEEEDFLEDSNKSLEASIITAFQLYEALNDTPESIQEDTIMTYKWWQKERFRPLGSFLFSQFKKNPKLKQDLKDVFKDHGDKISYFDFFEFLENNMNSGKDLYKPQDWEKDAIEMRLDKMGLAFIDYNEFRKFCSEYNIELGESLNLEDLEELIEKKENVSFQDYQITESDKFQGSSTMFKNEKAALKTAYELYKATKKAKQKRFLDPDFGPNNANDKNGSSNSLYIGGVVPQKGYVEPSEISWVYAHDLCEKGQVPKFILGGAAANDCRQGELGNCWFMSALSVVCQRDELIVGGMEGLEYDPDMIVDKEISTNLSKGIFPPIFHKFRSRGIYVLRYFKDFNWIYVIIDERLPVKTVTTDKGKEYKLVFGGCSDPLEMWVQLIEKGYAKLHGCYGNLISGYIDEGIQELTGFQPEKILIRNEHTGLFPHKQIEHYGKDAAGFWKQLKNWKEDGCLMGCSIKGYGKEGPFIIDGHPTGLILNHAYGIRDIVELIDYQGNIQHLIFLRNPWGKGEWTGAWSEESKEYKNNLKSLEKYNETLDFDEKIDFEKKQDDGSFFIHFDEWKDFFSTLFVNLDFPEKWTGVRFKSYWTIKNSMGLPSKYEQNLLKEYAQNPQFMVRTTQKTEIMFSLTQTGGRLPVNRKYYKYPFGETLNNSCVALFKLENKEETFLSQFKKELIQYMSPIKRERENSGRVILDPNETYIIVAACELKGTLGKFHLSIYIDQDLRNCEIKRVYPDSYEFTQDERKDDVLPEFIPEEAEKILRAPTWKLALVRQMIPFMMTEDDQEVNETD